MSFCPKYEEQIKNNLLQAGLQHFKKHSSQFKSSPKKGRQLFRQYQNYDLSEWQANQKISTYTSFPFLQIQKNKTKNQFYQKNAVSSMSVHLQKLNKKSQQQKIPLPNQVNLSFNPEEINKYKSKSKKKSNLLINKQDKQEENRKLHLQTYLINGQITTTRSNSQEIGTHRSSHLLRLLRQRQLLRKKRYSFDLQAGFVTKSFWNNL